MSTHTNLQEYKQNSKQKLLKTGLFNKNVFFWLYVKWTCIRMTEQQHMHSIKFAQVICHIKVGYQMFANNLCLHHQGLTWWHVIMLYIHRVLVCSLLWGINMCGSVIHLLMMETESLQNMACRCLRRLQCV